MEDDQRVNEGKSDWHIGITRKGKEIRTKRALRIGCETFFRRGGERCF